MDNSKTVEWKLYTYPSLIDKIAKFRSEKLPKETGGILIGSYDFQRKIIYVIDTVFSPSDSVENSKLYIRGSFLLLEKVEQIKRKTNGMLEYVGEWHSHPNDCNLEPSLDDMNLFNYLKVNMQVDGLPTLMAIAGINKKISWMLATI